MEEKKREFIRFGVDDVVVEIVSEPFVVNTFRGFAPVVDVKVEGEEGIKTMYISAKSLADSLTPAVDENGAKFTGLKLKIKKESADSRARYIVEKVSGGK